MKTLRIQIAKCRKERVDCLAWLLNKPAKSLTNNLVRLMTDEDPTIQTSATWAIEAVRGTKVGVHGEPANRHL
jgi:hypothetical protein